MRHNPIEADVREYFWSLVDKNGPLPDPATGVKSKCWLWLGSITDQGYGHLYTRTRAQIMASVPRHWASGEDSHLAHTTAKTVLQLRKLYAKGDLTQAMLAARFGLSLSNVKKILGRRSWKHI